MVIGESTHRAPILPNVAERLAESGLTMERTIHRRLPTQRGKNARILNEQVWILKRD